MKEYETMKTNPSAKGIKDALSKARALRPKRVHLIEESPNLWVEVSGSGDEVYGRLLVINGAANLEPAGMTKIRS